MRIDKFFSNIGMFSRKEIIQILKAGLITVNGKVVKNNDFQVDEYSDVVTFKNEQIIYENKVYIMLNKPKDYVCATFDSKEKTVLDLLPERFSKINVFPVGRLDKDTLGLLLLTNDGEFCHKVTSPKSNTIKKYEFELADDILVDDILKIENGITLKDEYTCLPCKIEMSNAKLGFIYIQEGKYHQVKRMFGAVGNKVIHLKRLSIGNVELDKNLKIGEWRKLTEQEIKNLI